MKQIKRPLNHLMLRFGEKISRLIFPPLPSVVRFEIFYLAELCCYDCVSP
jgi:hypothetical protein